MFLAAAPYFFTRFQSDEWTRLHYQPSIQSVSTITNLGTVYTLAKLQKNASYPWRVTISLLINCAVFTILAFSAVVMTDSSPKSYFAFVMVMVFGASLATGINQNGVFAYVSGFGRDEYMQAIMAGQGLAGVLPSIVQIFSVLAWPPKDHIDQGGEPKMPQSSSSSSAFLYFITSTAVSVITLLAFLHFLRQQPSSRQKLRNEDETAEEPVQAKTVSLWTLLSKLRFLAFAVFFCFLVTMVFPVYTAEIQSVNDPASSRIYDSSVFIPLGFLMFNLGDLAARMAVGLPGLSIGHYPQIAAVLAISRVMFIPLYQLCNINGRGAVIKSDFFYFVVQFLFGATNGYIGTGCMMGVNYWVLAGERPAAGGFMSMVLVGGLAAGSLLSFSVAE